MVAQALSPQVQQHIRSLEYRGYMKVNGAANAAGFSEDGLRAAFDRVQNHEGWKLPITATVHPADLCITVEAIVFYAGSETYIKATNDGRISIYAPGYYERVGA